MFYQLKSFDQSLSDAVISSQAGVLQGSFTAAQFMTAMLWGRVADSDWSGRKTVLLVGLLGTRKQTPGNSGKGPLLTFSGQFYRVLDLASQLASGRLLCLELWVVR